ncbi:hypothetical protein ACE83Q_04985 [Dellaglioa sp. P0083]|uniref:hypothetical protein n=1 Tax=Dellaglioa kimchii TaxID=3344667 RepID=UPI0038D4A057
MANNGIPSINEVGMLPNLLLVIKFQDGVTKYVRSEINKSEMDSFKSGAKNKFGFLKLTPENYWIGNDIVIKADNHFKVNDKIYDGNDIYRNGKDSY